ncbi:MAG: glycosyltransferase [Chitinophagaceae bacterium]|nr:glycosyltransferase [Chitinophagaceae bacterium]
MPTISLIIAFYKNLNALKLIFKALENQSYKKFEVIIAEDDNNDETKIFLHECKTSFLVKHVHQEIDNGFRKNEMLNAALKISTGKKIVFIDGDCIPHQHFLFSYEKHLKEKTIFFGRRVLLNKKITEQILATQHFNIINFWKLLISKNKNKKYLFYLPFLKPKARQEGIWGCNWGIMKKDILDVNGFDEDYISAGIGEDVDMEWRLLENKNKLFSIKQTAIVYHLHHALNYNDDVVEKNIAKMKEKKKAGFVFCKNGITKII